MQGLTLNAVSLTRSVAQKLGWPQLESMIVPINPMGMMMQQQSDGTQMPPGSVTETATTTKEGVQSQVQNAPATNQANSMATTQSSPQRQANTAPGANNKETSFK